MGGQGPPHAFGCMRRPGSAVGERGAACWGSVGGEGMEGEAVRGWCRLGAEALAESGELMTLVEGAGAEPGLARLGADEAGQARPWVEVVCYAGGPVPLLIGVE